MDYPSKSMVWPPDGGAVQAQVVSLSERIDQLEKEIYRISEILGPPMDDENTKLAETPRHPSLEGSLDALDQKLRIQISKVSRIANRLQEIRSRLDA